MKKIHIIQIKHDIHHSIQQKVYDIYSNNNNRKQGIIIKCKIQSIMRHTLFTCYFWKDALGCMLIATIHSLNLIYLTKRKASYASLPLYKSLLQNVIYLVQIIYTNFGATWNTALAPAPCDNSSMRSHPSPCCKYTLCSMHATNIFWTGLIPDLEKTQYYFSCNA